MTNYKEYLVPDNGGYRVAVQDAGLPIAEDWIAIPEGAETAVKVKDVIYFWKSHYFIGGSHDNWFNMSNGYDVNWYLRSVISASIIWQREQDEPFITPETTLNDQYAEIEEVRQALKDNVNHPSHYTQGKVECIDALESATIGKSGIEAVCVANIIKYLWRYEDKGGLESILKAKWYLDKLIECKK